MKLLISIVLAFLLILNCKKVNSNSKFENWSDYQGEMNWEDAKAHCRNIGMRLPIIKELQEASNVGLTVSWNAINYWSSTPSGEDTAYFFDIEFRRPMGFGKINLETSVRCVP